MPDGASFFGRQLHRHLAKRPSKLAVVSQVQLLILPSLLQVIIPHVCHWFGESRSEGRGHIHSFIHSFIHSMTTEHSLCTKY